MDARITVFHDRSLEMVAGASVRRRGNGILENVALHVPPPSFLLASGATVEYSTDVSVCNGMEGLV